MLKEIYCDSFISEGKIRKPITFHKGLNTILGSDTGSNSIGKSTFLMIVDFVFGGMDYIVKSVDVQKNVGPHKICYSFEFNNELFYFARSTDLPRTIYVCDDNYRVKDSITLDQYNKFLKDKYGMSNLEMSFRAAVGKFFRVYLRECNDEKHPLKSADRVPDKEGITELIQLFNKYSNIAVLMAAKRDADERHATFKKAIRFSQISAPANRTEYMKNVKEIDRLSAELIDLATKSEAGLLDIDSVKAKMLADTRVQLSRVYRQKSRLKAKMQLYDECNFSTPIEKDFAELMQFFPDVDVGRLVAIESFHADVTSALKAEYKKRHEELDVLTSACEQEIKILEEKIKSLDSVPNVSQSILNSYAEIKQNHDNLVRANNHFDKEKALKQGVLGLKNQISEEISSELLMIENTINTRMLELSVYVSGHTKLAPVLNLKDESHYTFDTPNDSGTGSRYKGLILFDLSILDTTLLPSVAHDSFMLKQIEDNVLERLLDLYSKTDKQVFIAIDKQDSYTKKAAELLEKTVVLRLSSQGNELFGRSWNVINHQT